MKRHSLVTIRNKVIRDIRYIHDNAESSNDSVYYVAKTLGILGIVPEYMPITSGSDASECGQEIDNEDN